MGRIFSLRGKMLAFDNQVTFNHNIFDYVSPDRTRAWKVLEAYIWPVEASGPNVGTDGFCLLTAMLATDSFFGPVRHDDLSDPTENRAFAWAQQNYNHRDAPTDFLTPNGFPLNQARFVVDPDTIVTKELYINLGTRTDYDLASEREWGYMIILEEQKITAAQSLFQQIKGMGQDLLS
jgi:hypothetical protein